VLNRVASATVRSLLTRVAGLLAEPGGQPAAPEARIKPGDILPELS
jgi:hypothetical protein